MNRNPVTRDEPADRDRERERDERMDALFTTSLDGVFFLELDAPIDWDGAADKDALLDQVFEHGRVASVNPALAVQYGVAAEVLIGRRPRDRWARDPAAWRARVRALYDHGHLRQQVSDVRADGSPLELEGAFGVLRDRAGRITGHFGIQRDITAFKALEARVRVAERMNSIGTLAAGVAHEINNPLAAVLTNVQFAGGVTEEAATGLAAEQVPALREALADAAAGATRIRDIVRDLRTLARGAETDEIGPIDPLAVLDLSVRLTLAPIGRQIELVRAIEPVPLVRGNASQLGQVFVNLIANAVQAFADDRPAHIRVTTSQADGRVVVEIADRGRGMPAEVVARIFDPFFTTHDIGHGMGLGLSMCHAIVSRLGGDIAIESAVGVGTTVRVRLPVAGPS